MARRYLEPINNHGTPAGYSAHRYRNEQACDECLKAHNEYNATREDRATPIKHGTDYGYGEHYRRGQKPCLSCKAAHKRYQFELEVQRAVKGSALRRRVGIPELDLPAPPTTVPGVALIPGDVIQTGTGEWREVVDVRELRNGSLRISLGAGQGDHLIIDHDDLDVAICYTPAELRQAA